MGAAPPDEAVRPLWAPNTVRVDIALTCSDGPAVQIARGAPAATRSACGSGTSGTSGTSCCAGPRHASGTIVRGSAAARASADQRERSHGNKNKSVSFHCKLPRSRPGPIESPPIGIFETRFARNSVGDTAFENPSMSVKTSTGFSRRRCVGGGGPPRKICPGPQPGLLISVPEGKACQLSQIKHKDTDPDP
jgi:hypothetical protein